MSAQEHSDDGASLSEQLIEACRRNNMDLLESIIESFIITNSSSEDKTIDTKGLSELINTTKDPLGNSPLHLTCKYGCYEVLDRLLDAEDLDLNVKNERTGDTPLHYAVEYSFKKPDYALFLTETLLEAGANPTIKNKDNLKPVQIADSSNEKLVMALEGAEYALSAPSLPPPPPPPAAGEEDEGSGSESEE